MLGLGTDHVISGPMTGLQKIACNGTTTHDNNTQTEIVTGRLKWPSGPIQ